MASETDTSASTVSIDHDDHSDSSSDKGHHHDKAPAPIKASAAPQPILKPAESPSLPEIQKLPRKSISSTSTFQPSPSLQWNALVGGAPLQDMNVKPAPFQEPAAPQPTGTAASAGSPGTEADQTGTADSKGPKKVSKCVGIIGLLDLIGSLLLLGYLIYSFVPLLQHNYKFYDEMTEASDKRRYEYEFGDVEYSNDITITARTNKRDVFNPTWYLVIAAVLALLGAIFTIFLMCATKKDNNKLVAVWCCLTLILLLPSIYIHYAWRNWRIVAALAYCALRFLLGLCLMFYLCCGGAKNQSILPFGSTGVVQTTGAYYAAEPPRSETYYPTGAPTTGTYYAAPAPPAVTTIPMVQTPQVQVVQVPQTVATGLVVNPVVTTAIMPSMYGYGYGYPGVGGMGMGLAYPGGVGMYGGYYGGGYYGGYGPMWHGHGMFY